MPTGLEWGPLYPRDVGGGSMEYALAAYPDFPWNNYVGALNYAGGSAPNDWTYKQIIDSFYNALTKPAALDPRWGNPQPFSPQQNPWLPPTQPPSGQLPPAQPPSGQLPPAQPGLPPTQGGGAVPQGYGIGQTLNGFGIPGFETSPMVGGGSWQGTVWNGAPYSGWSEPMIPESDVTNPDSPFYRPIYHNWQTTPNLQINPAVPYQTTRYAQRYGPQQAPYFSIHEQLQDALKGIESAKPGFNWANQLGQLNGYGLPGGWTSMLGFTPGGTNG